MRRFWVAAAGSVAALLLGLATTGCNTDAYCFDCNDSPKDAGQGGKGGATGAGGDFFDAGQSGGAGGGIDCKADILTDPKNCGFCNNVCNIPNAFPKCDKGFCVVDTCAPGWVDHNQMVGDGCEYMCSPTNGGVEVCDGADNDCNGLVDELTDLKNDPQNCGKCGTVCAFSHATPQCSMGICVMGPCEVGYNDHDKDPNDGCEYACTPTNGGVEVCDYTDNNCDTQVDEGFDLMMDGQNCGQCGQDCGALFPNTVPTCVAGQCSMGPCLLDYYDVDKNQQNGCEYHCAPTNGGVEICDGADNDCNGAVDDGVLVGEGAACGLSAVGECKLGLQHCQGGGFVCNGEVDPVVELCDGKDNDCNGTVDDACPTVNATDMRLDVGAGSGVNQAPSTQLHVASRGDTILAAYLDRRSGNADVRANVSTDGGLTWLAASDVSVATGATTQVEPFAAFGQSDAYISFGQFNGNNRDVWVARAATPFSAWNAVRADKDATSADAFFIRTAVVKPGATDQLIVVWESLSGTGNNVTTDVYLQASLDGGVTWLAADKRVNSVLGKAEIPALATDGQGKAFIAWRDNRNGQAEVFADTYDITAATFVGNSPISGGQPGQDLVIAADGGANAFVAWTDLRAAKQAIRVSRTLNSGAAWSADGTLVNPDSTFADAANPSIASTGGRVLVAWEDTRSGAADVRLNHSEDAGTTWLAQTSRADLGDAAGTHASTAPRVAYGSGSRVYVTWEDARSGQRDVYANFSNDKGTTFQPFDLRMDVGMVGAPSPAGGADSKTPFITSNAAGTRGVAVWVDYRTAAGVTGINADIYGNSFQ